MAIRGMFKYTAEPPNRRQRSGKAAAVIAEFELMRLACAAVPESSPSLAWRVRDNGVWSIVKPSVSRFVPRIDAVKAEVAPVLFDV